MSEVARVESDTLFSAITGIDVDSRGRVYVADWFAARVIVLGPDGDVVRSIGRKGLGPGEFRGIRGVQVLPGDSVLVYDPGAARLSVFPPDADDPSYTVNLGAALGGPEPFSLRRVAGESAYVALIRPQFTPDATSPRHDEIRALNLDGTPRGGALRSFPSRSFLRTGGPGSGYSVMPNPFGRQVFFAVAPDGGIHLVWNDSIAVETIDLSGNRVGGFTISYSAPPVSNEDVDEAVRELPPRMAAAFRPVLADSVPRRWPAVLACVADEKGRLWLRLSGSDAEQSEWAAFDADGRYRTSVFLPADVEVMAVKDDRLYGVSRSELGVPQVVVFGVSAQPAGGGS
ncbi:MAG: hypothetical protein KY444_12440 [Gemmatimonadetes bacterium]|nr:hypothetical protein [Gemmatimonadota bacterium]